MNSLAPAATEPNCAYSAFIPAELTTGNIEAACREILKAPENRIALLTRLFQTWSDRNCGRLIALDAPKHDLARGIATNAVVQAIMLLIRTCGFRRTESITRIPRGTLYRYSKIAQEAEGVVSISWVQSEKTNLRAHPTLDLIQKSSQEYAARVERITNSIPANTNPKEPRRIQRVLHLELNHAVMDHLDELEHLLESAKVDNSIADPVKAQIAQLFENAQKFAISLYEITLSREEHHPAVKRTSSGKVVEVCTYTLGQLDSRAAKIPTTDGYHLRATAERIVACGGTLDEKAKDELERLAARLDVPVDVMNNNMAMTLKRAQDVMKRISKNQDFQKTTRDGISTLEEVAEMMTTDREKVKELQERAFAKIRKRLHSVVNEIGLQHAVSHPLIQLAAKRVEEDDDSAAIQELTSNYQ